MSATTSSDAVTRRLAALARERRRALVAYLTAGHPDPPQSVAAMRAVAAHGADVLEVGVPFSDPMADGPVIQRSSQVALEHGVGLAATLQLIQEAAVDIPVVLFTYLNPLLAAGPLDAFGPVAAAHGVDGVLVTDLPVGADPDREATLAAGPLAFIRLVAPTTPDERMRAIAGQARGFVYLISRLGVTGVRADVPADLAPTIARLRAATRLPICVGFGVSTGEQARAIGRLADGVVVGSALVRAADAGAHAVGALTRELRLALDQC
jgi:tryptophan synthase alpha chain